MLTYKCPLYSVKRDKVQTASSPYISYHDPMHILSPPFPQHSSTASLLYLNFSCCLPVTIHDSNSPSSARICCSMHTSSLRVHAASRIWAEVMAWVMAICARLQVRDRGRRFFLARKKSCALHELKTIHGLLNCRSLSKP